eukprot:TRINITY_DN1130_c0_g2_i1.p1 TRINITY_DN1130_c0_g2~~TRINITY_DN1130_c0_g2_i1.p1  ORF type:complete len:367 (-),score=95.84 TRINITY_DN1130_c0_g2_i1:72-1100(-)
MHRWPLAACLVLGATLAHAYELCVSAGTTVAQPQTLYFEDHAPGLNPGLALLEKGIFDFPAGFFPSEEARAPAPAATRATVRLEDDSAFECCRLSGFNYFCADPEPSDGITINFEVEEPSTDEKNAVRAGRRAGFGVSASNTSGQVAISPDGYSIVNSITSTGRKLMSSYTMKTFPRYKLAHVTVVQLKHATDPYQNYDCSYQQLIAAVGTQVRFDVPNECTRVCSRVNSYCSSVMFCSQRVPNPNSDFATQFHFGIASFEDQTRQIEIAMLDAHDPQHNTYDFNVFVFKNCYPPIGENWRAEGKVVVSSNPEQHRFDIVIMNLAVNVGIHGFNAGNIPLPG